MVHRCACTKQRVSECVCAHDVDLLLNRAKWLCIINKLSSESRLSFSFLHCFLCHSHSLSLSLAHSLTLPPLLSLFKESLRDGREGGRRRTGGGGRESESACRAGEIVLIKEASAPCERSLVGQRLNRLLQKGTVLVLVVVVQLQDTMSAIISKGGTDGSKETKAEVE